MAMLRRLDGPVCTVHAGGGPHELPRFPSRASDWTQQSLCMDADSRAEKGRCSRYAWEAKEEEDMKTRARQAAALAEQRARLLREADVQKSLANEAEKRRQQDASWEAVVRQAGMGSAEIRALRQQCQIQHTSAERALQLLRDNVAREQELQHELAARDAQKMESMRYEQEAINREVAHRAAGKEHLRTLSSQAASSRAMRRAQEEADRQEERRTADEKAARVREEDVQRLAKHQQSQAQLHAALDQLVGERDRQRYRETAFGMKEEMEAELFNYTKSAFVEKLALERKSAEESRHKVLRQLASALRTNQLKAQEAEELCQTVRSEELQQREREQEELRLRQSLERKMACVCAHEESMRLLEERRIAAAKGEEKERQTLMTSFAEDAKLDQLGEQRRRMKQLAFSRDVEQALKDKREHEDKKRCLELEQLQAEKLQEERAAMLIAKERCRLLDAYGLYDSASKLQKLLGGGSRMTR